MKRYILQLCFFLLFLKANSEDCECLGQQNGDGYGDTCENHESDESPYCYVSKSACTAAGVVWGESNSGAFDTTTIGWSYDVCSLPTTTPTNMPTTCIPTNMPTTAIPTNMPTTNVPTLAPTTNVPSLSPTVAQCECLGQANGDGNGDSCENSHPASPYCYVSKSACTAAGIEWLSSSSSAFDTTVIGYSYDICSLPTTTSTNMPTTDIPTNMPITAIPTNMPTTTIPTKMPTTNVPSLSPTVTLPTTTPTNMPTTTIPTNIPSTAPSSFPSTAPTTLPSTNPTTQPSTSPSTCPSTVPSTMPTTAPSTCPTTAPTSAPSTFPSSEPTTLPSTAPSTSPTTTIPTKMPTTNVPSLSPTTNVPSLSPTVTQCECLGQANGDGYGDSCENYESASPYCYVSKSTCTAAGIEWYSSSSSAFDTTVIGYSYAVCFVPTTTPTNMPITSIPTNMPTTAIPTKMPTTNVPTLSPTTNVPSLSPTVTLPTNTPTNVPTTSIPTNMPTTTIPTNIPSESPTTNPTPSPTTNPSPEPTKEPTNEDTAEPTKEPTTEPTICPSFSPSVTSWNCDSIECEVGCYEVELLVDNLCHCVCEEIGDNFENGDDSDDEDEEESMSEERSMGEDDDDDECTYGHDDRPGVTSEERCLALDECCYYAEDDDCSLCGANECNWVSNNYNWPGEKYVGIVSSYAECIKVVQTQCPNADIANVEEGGSGECYCQYGNNFELDESEEWENCDLTRATVYITSSSSISSEEEEESSSFAFSSSSSEEEETVVYDCGTGQGKVSAFIAESNHPTEYDCGYVCNNDENCIAYDYTNTSLFNSCRLYAINEPRSDGGDDDRTYCVYNCDSCTADFISVLGLCDDLEESMTDENFGEEWLSRIPETCDEVCEEHAIEACGIVIPTFTPTNMPTDLPTIFPTFVPTNIPYILTFIPTDRPTTIPTDIPTTIPTKMPTNLPTIYPTFVPTDIPTTIPTRTPSVLPTTGPSRTPSVVPSRSPSGTPSAVPSRSPSRTPSVLPTTGPSRTPSVLPTTGLSNIPTNLPTLDPSICPSLTPTVIPSHFPTTSPETPSPTQSPITPTTSPTTSSRVTAVEFTQKFTGVDADKCSVAVPYIKSSTAESVAVNLDAVIVTPGAGCTEQTTEPPTTEPTKNPTTEPSICPSFSPSVTHDDIYHSENDEGSEVEEGEESDDECTSGHDDRPGKSSQRRCVALDGCCYFAEDDDCSTCGDDDFADRRRIQNWQGGTGSGAGAGFVRNPSPYPTMGREGVEFVIQIIYESEVDKTDIVAILNRTQYAENFTTFFAAAISGTEDAELFSSVISISIAERVTVEIDEIECESFNRKRSCNAARNFRCTWNEQMQSCFASATIIETTLEVIAPSTKAGDESTVDLILGYVSLPVIIGIVGALLIIFLVIIAMWYVGYFKGIRKCITRGNVFRGAKKRRTKKKAEDECEVDNVIAPDASKNETEKVEFHSGSNLDDPNPIYAPRIDESDAIEVDPTPPNEQIDPFFPANEQISPQKVPGRVMI